MHKFFSLPFIAFLRLVFCFCARSFRKATMKFQRYLLFSIHVFPSTRLHRTHKQWTFWHQWSDKKCAIEWQTKSEQECEQKSNTKQFEAWSWKKGFFQFVWTEWMDKYLTHEAIRKKNFDKRTTMRKRTNLDQSMADNWKRHRRIRAKWNGIFCRVYLTICPHSKWYDENGIFPFALQPSLSV